MSFQLSEILVIILFGFPKSGHIYQGIISLGSVKWVLLRHQVHATITMLAWLLYGY